MQFCPGAVEATECRFEYPQFVEEKLDVLFGHFGLALKRRSYMEDEKKPSWLPWSPKNIAALKASDPELCKLVESVFEAAKELFAELGPRVRRIGVSRGFGSRAQGETSSFSPRGCAQCLLQGTLPWQGHFMLSSK